MVEGDAGSLREKVSWEILDPKPDSSGRFCDLFQEFGVKASINGGGWRFWVDGVKHCEIQLDMAHGGRDGHWTRLMVAVVGT